MNFFEAPQMVLQKQFFILSHEVIEKLPTMPLFTRCNPSHLFISHPFLFPYLSSRIIFLFTAYFPVSPWRSPCVLHRGDGSRALPARSTHWGGHYHRRAWPGCRSYGPRSHPRGSWPSRHWACSQRLRSRPRGSWPRHRRRGAWSRRLHSRPRVYWPRRRRHWAWSRRLFSRPRGS